jgi:integrase
MSTTGDGASGRKAFKKTEVPYRPLYQMRHTYATLALAAGADVYWVSRQLGHKSRRPSATTPDFSPPWTSAT